jgi:hypothetical protein
MTRTNFWVRSGAAIITLAAAACSSDLPSGESTGPIAELASGGHDAVLSKVGRGLAVALADPEMRAWIRSRIDASPYVEWRIPFRDVLLHEADLPEMRRVADLAQLTSVERVKQKALPPLELYFPIPQHRTSWRADAPVQLAVRVGHGDTYTLYSMDGTASITRGDHVPPIATLVLAPSEIDYDDLPSAVRGGSRTGPGMEAGFLQGQQSDGRVSNQALPPPDEAPPPPPTGGVNTSRHTRLSYFKTSRYHDDWFGGSDEVEIFGSVHGGYKECASRTDVHPNREYPLDLANSLWTIATAIPWGTETVFIDAFEDDDARCVRRPSDDRYGSTSLTVGQYETIVGTSNPGHIAVRVHSVIP